ncbi:sphingomyelin phosphodiesterase [Scaptodrosophila lebanonensis]|uniref:Sphingomyelin phosphodiesterase n=1 Tax=Drosophila lebanonensis TaxID=7225 RepID=A0A6J2T506_DROLE|nr:sphingomyelin phosphodiesterase [Scaptodrosophila lebanonensis]
MKWLLLLVGAIAASAHLLPEVPNSIDYTQDDKSLSDLADSLATVFEEEYHNYLKTNVETARFQQLTTTLAKMHSKKDIFTKDLPDLEPRDQFLTCTLCRSVVNVFARTIREEEDGQLYGKNSTEVMQGFAMDVCRRLELQTEEVCGGLIDFYINTVEYVMRHSEIDSQNFCSLFMNYNFCNTGKNPDYNWTLTVNSEGEPISGSKSDTPVQSETDLKICHFTDIHHDPLYEPGSLASCDEPMCCQRHKDTAESTGATAGYWGDYRDCDLPWHAFESALKHATSNVKCDFVYQTGDIVDHMVWSTSVEKNVGVLSKVTDQLASAFDGVGIYPCIGNHEPHPLNLFSPEDVPDNINTKWLYEELYNDWSRWLPEDTKETILKGGYYTVSPRPGFRIIALNSNDCYTDNFWLYYSGRDKIPQLEWFHDVLLAAERAGEHVHILTHIPAGDGTCWSVWAREYNRCITRFHKTISGIFNGHSHKDELNVHYSDEGYATAVAWNGGALTTYSNKNPNYRVYDVNAETYDVTNHYTFIYNLTEANLNPDAEPNWYQEYQFAEEFTTDTSPAGMDKLLENMADNPQLLRKYWRYRVTSADPQLNTGCNDNCLASVLCRAAVTVNDRRERCEELKERLFIALENESTSTTTPSPKPEDDGATALSTLGISALLTLVLALRLTSF